MASWIAAASCIGWQLKFGAQVLLSLFVLRRSQLFDASLDFVKVTILLGSPGLGLSFSFSWWCLDPLAPLGGCETPFWRLSASLILFSERFLLTLRSSFNMVRLHLDVWEVLTNARIIFSSFLGSIFERILLTLGSSSWLCLDPFLSRSYYRSDRLLSFAWIHSWADLTNARIVFSASLGSIFKRILLTLGSSLHSDAVYPIFLL